MLLLLQPAPIHTHRQRALPSQWTDTRASATRPRSIRHWPNKGVGGGGPLPERKRKNTLSFLGPALAVVAEQEQRKTTTTMMMAPAPLHRRQPESSAHDAVLRCRRSTASQQRPLQVARDVQYSTGPRAEPSSATLNVDVEVVGCLKLSCDAQ